MKDKSHVSLEHKICIVCGHEYSTSTVLLHKRLRKSLSSNMITGWGMCDEHQKLKDDGFVAMVGCDEAASIHTKNGNINPEGAFRTGPIAHLNIRMWDRIMNIPMPKDMMCFCEDEVINQLNSILKNAS